MNIDIWCFIYVKLILKIVSYLNVLEASERYVIITNAGMIFLCFWKMLLLTKSAFIW